MTLGLQYPRDDLLENVELVSTYFFLPSRTGRQGGPVDHPPLSESVGPELRTEAEVEEKQDAVVMDRREVRTASVALGEKNIFAMPAICAKAFSFAPNVPVR